MGTKLLKLNSRNKYEYIFYASVYISFICWALSFLTWKEGEQLTLFFRKGGDFFADSTNVIGYSGERNVYNDTHFSPLSEKAYPPLTYVIMWFFSKTVNIKEYYAKNSFVELNQNTKFMAVFLIFVLISVVILYELIKHYKNGTNINKILMGCALIFSAPMLYALERANVVILCLICILIYIFNYKSDNKVKKEIALIAFAFAVAFKITPAVLGILLLYDKKFKEAVRAVIYSIIVFFAPFAFFYGGFINNVKQMVSNVFSNLDKYTGATGTSLASILDRYVNIESLDTVKTISTIGYVIAVIMLIGAAFEKTHWKKVMSSLLILTVIPSHAEFYCIIFMIPAFILFFNEEKHKKTDYIVLVGICAICSFIYITKNYQQAPLYGLSVILVYSFINDVVLIVKAIISAFNSKVAKAK